MFIGISCRAYWIIIRYLLNVVVTDMHFDDISVILNLKAIWVVQGAETPCGVVRFDNFDYFGSLSDHFGKWAVIQLFVQLFETFFDAYLLIGLKPQGCWKISADCPVNVQKKEDRGKVVYARTQYQLAVMPPLVSLDSSPCGTHNALRL